MNPIENMWTVHDKQVSARKLTHLVERHRFWQGEWLNIQPEACQKLVDGYQKRLIKVKNVQGTLNQIVELLFVYFRSSRSGHIY